MKCHHLFMCQLFRRGVRAFKSLLNNNLYLNMSKPFYKTNAKLRKCNSKLKSLNRPMKFKISNGNSDGTKMELLSNPIKSESDKKEYRVIKLGNGLRALLISDMHSLKNELVAACADDVSDNGEDTDEDSAESGSCDSGSEVESDEEEGSGMDDEERGSKAGGNEEQEEKMAACALCVGVGSYSDPHHVQGLAHFVEHMLFMGSTKYPQENDFDAFIKKKGGSDNASTDCEMTTFHFEIPEEHLAEAMDKFAHFFISPLMKQEAMQREREAIQSEFALSIPVDSHRRDQLLSMFLPIGHPGRTFMWGDERSLCAPLGPQDPELHKEAHEFRKKHYSAHRMTLAVQARLPLNTLEKYVSSIFSQIQCNDNSPNDFSRFDFNKDTVTKDFHSLYYVKPIGSKNKLHLTWCMRSFLFEYKSKPHQYVSWILGHEGTGSLLSHLRKKVWALAVYAGNSESGIDHTSINCYFTITLLLTKDGLLNVDKVIEDVFSYINLLKKQCPDERIYKEIKDVEDINFKFEKEVDPSDNVEGLAENMQLYPPEHFITGEDLYYEFRPELVKHVFDSMQPNKVNIMIQSQDHDPPIQYTDTEFWFGTKYIRKDIPKASIDRWESIEPLLEYHLPEPNIFISDDFSLIALPEDLAEAFSFVEIKKKENLEITQDTVLCDQSAKKSPRKPVRSKRLAKIESRIEDPAIGDGMNDIEKAKWACDVMKKYFDAPPELILSDPLLELWYKPDYKFRLPNAIIYLHFMPASFNKTPKISCMTDLWCNVMDHYLMERLYPATMAGLSYSIFPSDRGIAVKLSGFSQKLPVLVDVITKAIADTGHLTEDWFAAIKDQLVRVYIDKFLKPSQLSKLVRFSLILHHYPNSIQKLSALKSVDYSDMKSFSEDMMRKMKVRVLVQGNMTKEQALGVVKTVQHNISWEELKEEERPKIQVMEIPIGRTLCRVKSMNSQSVNSHITNYYQWGEYTLIRTMILELIMLLMEEPVFDQLRTKEQLGYNVFSMLRYTFGILGYSITVNTQANKHSADHVDSRIKSFLESFKGDMSQLTERTFDQTKAALIKQKRCADVTLKEEASKNWSEIVSLEYTFDRLQQEIECIKTITLDHVKECFDDFYENIDNDKFRLLSVQIIGNSQADKTDEADDDDSKQSLKQNDNVELGFLNDETDSSKLFVCDIQKFKNRLRVLPEFTVQPKIANKI